MMLPPTRPAVEQRTAPRVPARFEVYYGIGKEHLRGSTYDISSGGIGLVVEKSCLVNSEINLRFRAPGAKRELVFMKGVVRWACGHRMGVQLMHVKETDQQRILELVEHLARQQIK